jgi:hypothetical protein
MNWDKEKANPSCGLALFFFGSPSGVGGNEQHRAPAVLDSPHSWLICSFP